MQIKGYAVAPLLKRTAREVMDDNVLGLAAQTAYYFFFSLFPLFLFLTPLLSLVGDQQETFTFIMRQLETAIPASAFELVSGVVRQVVFDPNAPGIASVGALLALWSGSNIFTALINALNQAYDVTDTRPWWKKKLLSVGMVLVSGVTVLTATIILLSGEQVVEMVGGWVGLGDSARTVWKVIQIPLAIAMLVALAWMQYLVLPHLRQSKWHALTAAVVAVALWILVTLAFRYYVQNFGNYNKTYGTFGGIIVLLMWMYLSMLALLTGGELGAELHKGTGATDPRRGAVLYGRIAAGSGRGASLGGDAAPMRAEGRE